MLDKVGNFNGRYFSIDFERSNDFLGGSFDAFLDHGVELGGQVGRLGRLFGD